MSDVAGRWDGAVAAVGALLAFVAGLLPWVRTASAARTGVDLVGPVLPILAIGALASLALLDRTTGARFLVATVGLATIGLAAFVFEGAINRGSAAVTPAPGLYLSLVGGAAMAIAGSVAVLLDPGGAGTDGRGADGNGNR